VPQNPKVAGKRHKADSIFAIRPDRVFAEPFAGLGRVHGIRGQDVETRALVGQCIAAGVAQHVWVRGEGQGSGGESSYTGS
jgi:hypothetical protein